MANAVRMKPFWIFILVMLLPKSLAAQDSYKVDTKYPVHNLMPALDLLETSDPDLKPLAVLRDSSANWQSRSDFGRYLNLGFTYWGKIKLVATDSLTEFRLNLEDKMIGPPAWTKSNGKVDIYGFVGEKLIFHQKTGVEYPRKERSTKSHWVRNEVRLPNFPVGEEVTLLIKAQGNSIGYPAYFNLSLRHSSQAYYHQIYQFHNSFNIFMFGIAFIVFLYHLLQYIYLREKVMLWFSVWLFFITITQAMTIGLFIGATTVLRFSFYVVVANGVFYTFWFFGRAFINSKAKFPSLDKFMLGLGLFVLLESIIVALYVPITNAQTSFTGVGVHYYVLNIYTLASLVLSVILLTKKDKFAKYFGFGSITASLFLLLGTFWSMGYISLSTYSVDPFVTGIFLQIVIYSFGIAYRRQVIQSQMTEQRIQGQRAISEMQRIKDLDTIKTRFFANISHEFRTPLTLISGPIKRALGYAQNQSEDIALKKKDFEIIVKNTDRLQNLVDQLLDLSKIESGKEHLSLTQGGLIKFIRSLVYSFESLAERNNISLNTRFPNELDQAFYDKDKLEKILTNILSNAFKYTPKNGSVTVNVEHDGHYLQLEIADTGKGIGKEDVRRIFERFYRVEGTEEQGSGIGLALTKELIDLHNGKISVDSVERKGTTFKIRLPVTLKNLPESVLMPANYQQQSASEAINEDLVTKESSAVEKVITTKELPLALVVEDNPDLQYYIADVIHEQYNIIKASDGAQGERMAFEHTPDIIITDVMMPKKDGFEFCHSLKQNAKTSHIPIIMLTAKAGEVNKIEGLSQGADAYLTKPFNEKELLIRMKNLIESRKNLWDHFKALDMLLVDDIGVNSIDDKFLQDVFKTIKEHLDNERFGVEDIAAAVGFSRSQLHRKLKALSGKSANQLITEIRLNEAHRLLKSNAGSVSEIAYSVGYSNLSYFTKSFKEKFGVLPSKV